jgi:alpha-1,3-mannosyltransferase
MKSRWPQALTLGTAVAVFTWICFSLRSPVLPDSQFQGHAIDDLSAEGISGLGDLQSVDAYLESIDMDTATVTTSARLVAMTKKPKPIQPPTVPEPAKVAVLQDHLKDEQSKPPKDDGSGISQEVIGHYVESIFDLRSTRFERMECPGQFDIGQRYHSLRASDEADSKIKYFITLDLTQVVSLLPRLMGTIIHTMHFLGHKNCGLSIIEGRSNDGTYPVLAAMRHKLEAIGVKYWLHQSDIDPHGEGMERISALAELRNMAMAPLLDEPHLFTEDVVTVFSNDVAICPDDILELLFQHIYQNATMTCGMDWVYGGDTFYE